MAGHSSFAGVRAEGLRFLVTGAINTGATFLLYWALLLVAEYRVAYTIAFVSGIGLAYVLNSRYVFKVKASARSALIFPIVYAVQYVLGLFVLWVWTDKLALPKSGGVFATVAVTIPVTFVLSRAILKRNRLPRRG